MPDDTTKDPTKLTADPVAESDSASASDEASFKPQPSFSTQAPPPPASAPSIQDSGSQTSTPAVNQTTPTDNPPLATDEPKTVVTSDHVPKKYGGRKIIATIFAVLFLVGGVAAGVFLVQREQEIRERAASGRECQQSQDCILLDEPGNSGSFEAPRDIIYVNITARDARRYDSATNDGCYEVGIEERRVSWNRVGSGPDCPDVSNVQVYLREERISDSVSCPISPDEGKLVIILNESAENQIYSNKGEAQANFGPVAVSVPEGSYRVTLVTYDDHHLKPSQTQPREQWYLMTDSSGNSGTTSDLPDSEDWLIEVVNQNFSVASPISSVTARHAAYPDNSNPNSLSPVCASFENIEEIPTPTVVPTPTVTPTPPPGITAQCNDVRVYDIEWNLLTTQQLSSLTEGDTIRFAVSGAASAGTFDKARFTVNSLSQGETNTLKPGSNEFYVEYEIPEGVTSFVVTAQVHHNELGWF